MPLFFFFLKKRRKTQRCRPCYCLFFWCLTGDAFFMRGVGPLCGRRGPFACACWRRTAFATRRHATEPPLFRHEQRHESRPAQKGQKKGGIISFLSQYLA
ncbi:hypothetical protein TW95_gp0339 [Pandoravirus inopinatum]|uniref:Uncharacterized protein n=1 Tax=Pandoravirus inopinatum TaxID=1605721 RepID=A0A0B5IWJ6_9VIRU|nr:hypothetical protein TW95_gp0339 [Pandoravirus inopinatum]AJF97073.1 hypothetical protein [Pandoravirus inopinatum]